MNLEAASGIVLFCAAVVALVLDNSPLAWLYALPVERWLELGAALSLNRWFLAVVAAWRVRWPAICG